MFAMGFLGVATLILIGVVLSVDRKAIKLRTVGSALALQIGIGAFVLYIPWGKDVLASMSGAVISAIEYGNDGVLFLFGNLVNFSVEGIGFVFALKVLPLIIFFSSLIAVLYHIGLMQWVIRIIGGGLHKILNISKSEAMSATSNVFVGQSEAPLVIKPYMPKMTDSEFFAVMVGGLASVSGTTLAGYAGLGVPMEYLLAASFMAMPGGVLFAKLMLPETGKPADIDMKASFSEKPAINIIAAASNGAQDGVKLAVMVGGMLLAVVGLVSLFNGMLGWVGSWFDIELSLQIILGFIFAPLAWLLGVPWQDAGVAGGFIGQKVALNEFVAYIDLSNYLGDAATVAANGYQVLDDKTKVIASFALCGFANISSVAILMGGLSTMAPNRRDFIATMGVKGVIAGTCSNLMSAAIAGVFYSLSL